MKIEIKNAILEMLSDDATITELRDTAENFTWVFDYVKTNAEQLRARFKTESYNTTGDYKTTFFVNGLRAVITTWLDNNAPPEKSESIRFRIFHPSRQRRLGM